MIGLLSITRIITFVAIVYAILTVLCAELAWNLGESSWSIRYQIWIAVSGAAALQLVLTGWLYFGWRRLWRWFPALNHLVYPDMGGEWNIEIHWQDPKDSGVVGAKATIRQDFLRISMEVTSPSSDSQTLIAQPKRDPESGVPLLYYVYVVTPKSMGSSADSPYFGAAILRFSKADGGKLSGNYWTTKQTTGHFSLSGRK